LLWTQKGTYILTTFLKKGAQKQIIISGCKSPHYNAKGYFLTFRPKNRNDKMKFKIQSWLKNWGNLSMLNSEERKQFNLKYAEYEAAKSKDAKYC